jgi:hypothetical protein
MDLLKRIAAILVTPEREWPAIAGEASTASQLLIHYVAILALIPAVAHVIGASLVGWYAPILPSLAGALVIYVSTVAVVYGAGLVANTLAPRFGARRDLASALKLAVYSATPAWLAGFFLVVPGLSFLAVLGLYGAYLFWLGLPVLMQAPAEKSLPYAAAVTACGLCMALVLGVLDAHLLTAPR